MGINNEVINIINILYIHVSIFELVILIREYALEKSFTINMVNNKISLRQAVRLCR